MILYSAVYPIAMTTCKSTRQDLLLESIQNLCVAHVCEAALELILHDTSFAIALPAYSQSVRD